MGFRLLELSFCSAGAAVTIQAEAARAACPQPSTPPRTASGTSFVGGLGSEVLPGWRLEAPQETGDARAAALGRGPAARRPEEGLEALGSYCRSPPKQGEGRAGESSAHEW